MVHFIFIGGASLARLPPHFYLITPSLLAQFGAFLFSLQPKTTSAIIDRLFTSNDVNVKVIW